jgi:tungstate transport system ATP-binding protein
MSERPDAPAPAPIVAVSGIRVVHDGAETLAIDALEVLPGEVLGIIGPNGSGKSTLLRLLGLLESPAAGEVRFHGRPVRARTGLAERRRMATVFQQPLLASTSVARNVSMGLRFRGVPRAEQDRQVGRWLERLGVERHRDQAASTLSGGEAQRVALARALVVEPELLLLDEPFAALDPPSREALIADLGVILRADRVTTVLVTHDRGEARALADRVAVLMGGQIRQIDATRRVFNAPVSEEVARFVGVETIVAGTVVGHDDGVAVIDVGGGQRLQVARPARPGPVRICLRPEDVALVPAAEWTVTAGASNHLPGRVVRLAPSPPLVRIVVDCGFPLVAALPARSVEEFGLVPGVPVVAMFRASAAHLIPLAPAAAMAGGLAGLAALP